MVLTFVGKNKTLIEIEVEDASIAHYRRVRLPDRRFDGGSIFKYKLGAIGGTFVTYNSRLRLTEK